MQKILHLFYLQQQEEENNDLSKNSYLLYHAELVSAAISREILK